MLFASMNGRWYLVGWCRLRDGVRWFVVNRIERARATRIPCEGHPIEEIGEPPESARSVIQDA